MNDKVTKEGQGSSSGGKKKKYDSDVGGAISYVADTVMDFYENGNEKLKDILRDASRLGGVKIPPTPRLPTVDCEQVVSRCLFVRIIGAKELLAMDSGTAVWAFPNPDTFRPFKTGD